MKSDGTRQKKSKKIKPTNNKVITKPDEPKQGIEEPREAIDESKQPVEEPTNEPNSKVEATEDGLDDKLMELSDQFKERNKTASESSSVISESAAVDVESEVKNDEPQDKTFTLHDSMSGENNEKAYENVGSDPDIIDVKEDTDYVNPRGVRFVQDGSNGINAANVPYGLPCIRELLRFLISLINYKNSDIMISMGLNLLTIGLESGVDHIASYQSLLSYVKDDLCKKIYHLLSFERLPIYANALRVSFLLFESLRFHLKLQMEHFFIKLMDIIVSDSNKITQEQKEITIDYLLQLLRVPGFSTELYLNYDCSLNCTNLFEDLTKLLSKVV